MSRTLQQVMTCSLGWSIYMYNFQLSVGTSFSKGRSLALTENNSVETYNKRLHTWKCRAHVSWVTHQCSTNVAQRNFYVFITGSKHSISNSTQFLEIINDTSIAPDECMVSLFTCKPLELTRETIVNLLGDFNLNLPPTATNEMLEHCLSNYFQFGNGYYQQVKVRL